MRKLILYIYVILPCSIFSQTIEFERITEGDLVNTIDSEYGIFFADYNNDNKVDLFTSGYNSSLFQNENTIFNNTGLSFNKFGSASWGDYNNDGYIDLFATTYVWGGGAPPSTLYKNNGDSTFTEIPFDTDGRVNNSIWLDFNKDGLLDIFLSYLDLGYGKMYINNGDDAFVEVLELDGASGFSTFFDCDNDGDLDLYTAKYNHNVFYVNNGNGSFYENTSSIIAEDGGHSKGFSVGDIDNDGDLDLFVANGSDQEINNLYINDGNGEFTKTTTGVIVEDLTETYGSSFCDFDNDGKLDLALSNFQQKNYLYKGNGDGTFTRQDESIIMNEGLEYYDEGSIGCACADINQDGFIDLFFSNKYTSYDFFYSNIINTNNWCKIKLIGSESNRSAIGSKVILWTNNQQQFREITSQTGLAGQNELNANFGLGLNTSIDSIIILWPSGAFQKIIQPEINQLLEVTEIDMTDINEQSHTMIQAYPNPMKFELIIENPSPDNFLIIELLDVKGQVVINHKANDKLIIIKIDHLHKGMYILKLSNHYEVLLKKFLKI